MLAAADWIVLLAVASRWIHILTIALVVGGTFFMHQVLFPAVSATFAEEAHGRLREAVRQRWSKVIHLGVALILITGFFNFYVAITVDGRGGVYHMIFGFKFLAALALMFIAIALTSRSEAFAPFRANARMWMGVNIALAALIILLSSILKSADRLLPGSAQG